MAFEDIIDTISTTNENPAISETVKALFEGPVQDDQPLSSTTARYVNALNRETYGDDVEAIATKKELERANKAAAVARSLEDYDMSILKDVDSVARGTLSVRQMQLNALTRSQDIVYAEDNGDYGLAMENMDQLTMNAAATNPDIQAEDESFTANYNRVLTNKAMLEQARKELVPYGLVENLMSPGAVLAGAIHGPEGAATEEAKKAEGFFSNLAQFAWNFVPFYTEALSMRALPKDIKEISAVPHVNELAHFAYWQDAIDKDSNAQFRKRLSDYVKYCKDQGLMDTEIEQVLGKVTNPSPILEDLGFGFDILWVLSKAGTLARMSTEAYRATFKALRGTNKEMASKLIDTLAKGSKEGEIGIDKVEKAVLSLQDELRKAEVIGDTRAVSDVNLDPKVLGIDIEGDVLTDFDNLLKDSAIRQTSSGNLELVYHGSPEKDLRKMDPRKIGTHGTSDGTGFYFTTKEDVAGHYVGSSGKKYKAVLDIKKPIYQGDREISQEQLREFYSQFLKKYSPDFMKEKNAEDVIDTMAKAAFDEKFDKRKMEQSLADLEAYYEGSDDAYLVVRREQIKFFGKDGYVIANADFDDGVRVAWLPEQVHFLNAKRTVMPVAGKRAETLEEFLASKGSKEMLDVSNDLSTPVGRLKAARDTKGAAEELKKVAASDSRDPETIKIISNDYFESTAKGIVTKDNLARLGDIIDEKNYKITLQKAVNSLEYISKMGLSGRREELLQKAVMDATNSLDASNNLYRSTGISDILRSHYQDLVQEDNVTGDLFALIRSNKKYKSREAADKARRALAAEESWSMPLPDGKWGVDVKVKLNGGFGTLAAKDSRNPADDLIRHRGFSSVFTATSKPTYIRDLDELRELESSQIQELTDSIRKLAKGIKGEDKDTFDAMINTSVKTGSFFKPEAVAARLKSDTARQAYNGYRLLNDLDHVIINNARRDTLVKGGWKQLHFGDTSLGYSQVLRLTPSEALSRLKETQRRIIMGTPDAAPMKFSNMTITEEALKEKLDNGWVIVERSFGPDEFTQARSIYYLLDGHQIVENDIPQIVTHYVAGGRRFFDRKATYAKQYDIRADEDGIQHVVGVRTIAADMDSVGFSNKVVKINNIRRELAKNYNSPNEKKITEMIEQAGLGDVPFHNAETFKAWCMQHGVDFKNLDNDLLPMEDGKLIPSLDAIRRNIDVAVDDAELEQLMHRSAHQAYNKEFQVQQWHRSGKDLLGWNFKDTVEPVDFDKNLRYMANDMVNARVMNTYQDMMANSFAKNWGDLVKNGSTMSAKQMLNSVHHLSDFTKDPAESLRALIFAENYRAVRGIPTGLDQDIAQIFNSMVKSLNGKLPEGFDEIAHGARLTAKTVKEWGPLHQQRHLTSVVMMGLLRTKQLITQAAPIYYTFLMKPTSTIKALKTVFPLTTELLTSKGSWSKATEKFLKSEKLYTPETKAMWSALKDARIFENTPYAGAFEMADSASKWSKFDRIQFAPKNFGEIFNRTLAHITAYHELGYGAKGITSAKEMAAFRSLGNTLYMNMSPTGLSRIQNTEFMKTMMQFKSANLRFWETALFDRNLTAAERRRLGIGLLATGGLRTFLGVEWARTAMNAMDDAINFFKPETLEGQPSRLEEEESVARRIIDAGVLGYISGSEGYDWGAFIRLPATELLEGFADIFADPFRGIPSIAADTAIMNTVKDIATSVNAFYHARDSYEGWKEAMKVMATTPQGVPGIKDKFTAAYVWNTATMWDTRGRLTMEDASLVDKVMSVFGVPRMTTQDLQAAYIDDAHEDAKIDEYVKEYTRAWNLWKTSHNDAYWEQMMSLEQLPTLNEYQKALALQKLQKTSDYDTIVEERKRRMYREWDNPAGSNYMTKLDNLERK